MKQVFLILCTCVSLSAAFSQTNSKAYLKDYKDYKAFYFFDSLNKRCVSELAGLNGMYECFVTFKVDTNANITDFLIEEIPVSKPPQLVKTYIEKLLKASNGLWIPQIKNGRKVISDEMIYRIDILRKNQSIQERTKDTEKIMQFYYEGNGIQKEPMSKFLQSEAITIFIEY
jgi:hypothetical protein